MCGETVCLQLTIAKRARSQFMVSLLISLHSMKTVLLLAHMNKRERGNLKRKQVVYQRVCYVCAVKMQESVDRSCGQHRVKVVSVSYILGVFGDRRAVMKSRGYVTNNG